jgi:hypothetical protein
VSRLWRDRLLISLAPAEVALLRVARGLRPRILGKQSVDCDPAFGAAPWQGAVAALGTALEPLRGERLDATLVLSNHFVRYAVVRPEAALASAAEQLGLARFQFARIYGERARGWNVRLSAARRGAPRLASAVDAGLVPAIRACFPRGAKLRLRSIQPYLMAAFNCWRGSLAQADGWLLLVEPQRACLALLAASKWGAVQSLRGEYAGPEQWVALLEREQLRTDTDAAPQRAHVHAPARGRVVSVAGEAQGWSMHGLGLPPLEGFDPREDARFAMALTAR